MKTLLLNSSYEVLNFVNEKKCIKLLFKNKVDVISCWDDNIVWGSGRIKHPSILRLKNHVRRNYFNSNFSRKALVKRDRNTCQYCHKKLAASQLTIDHIIPRSQGGITSFTNCVVCCQSCNIKKADKTIEESNMVLFKKPTHPSFSAQHCISDQQEYWSVDWDDFLENV